MLRRYLAREIEVWTRSGLLQPGQGEVLLADHDRRHSGFSLSGVLAVLAAVLFGAAVVALVAANWEGIPRVMRVAGLLALIAAGLGLAAAALRRGAAWVAEAALVFALLCYGAGLALIGQMYHISGDATAFTLTWAVGALVVALSFSSALASAGAGALVLGYMASEADVFSGISGSFANVGAYATALALILATAFAAWRARSALAGHLSAIAFVGWTLWVIDDTTTLDPGYVLAALGAAAFALGSFAPASVAGVIPRHGALSGYGAVMLLVGLAMVQASLIAPASLIGSGLVTEMAMAALILVASVVVLAVAGGENRLARRFAYFAFTCETIYVVGETLGSLLGSSGFLFLGGLLLALIAFAVMKIEKRFKKTREASA
ncbi:DUF2157 domain-containing protein [Hoeflea olei]|uniref:DUF2157 domain-containing protein n=1 Tax=Hoeflea olei TaxID=1480615 RepID=A0A1C1YZ97_9HYPH|nr:DUF2157 domain-containing protein [Hoeflea olei]OCW58851.1 hypothetical protein AWJ14_20950 [Hoeflea olei]